MILKVFIIWYLAINIVLFCLMGIDKHRARHNKWRVSEAALLTCSCLGAFLGGFAGMHLFHHKTKKLYFHVVFFLSAAIHIFLIITVIKLFTA